jgi:hypothetical protein
MMDDEMRALWISMRQALLMQVDAIERFLHISPRTAELKRQGRDRMAEALAELERQDKTSTK